MEWHLEDCQMHHWGTGNSHWSSLYTFNLPMQVQHLTKSQHILANRQTYAHPLNTWPTVRLRFFLCTWINKIGRRLPKKCGRNVHAGVFFVLFVSCIVFIFSTSMSRFNQSGRLSDPPVGQAGPLCPPLPAFLWTYRQLRPRFGFQRVVADQHFDSKSDHESGITSLKNTRGKLFLSPRIRTVWEWTGGLLQLTLPSTSETELSWYEFHGGKIQEIAQKIRVSYSYSSSSLTSLCVGQVDMSTGFKRTVCTNFSK